MTDRWRSLVILAVTAGCSTVRTSSPTPQPAGVDVPVPVEIPPTPNSRSKWAFQPTSSASAYASTGTTTLELSSDSGAIRETIQARIRFTVTVNRNETPITVTGSIEEVSIDGGPRIGTAPAAVGFPLQFRGRISHHQPDLELVTPTSASLQCENPAASALASVRRLIFVSPQELSLGAAWTDSTSSLACRGSLPLILSAVQTYKVIGEINHSRKRAILIERTERSTSTGEGTQGQHRMTVRGSSTGSTKLYLDPVTGSLLEAEDEQRTALTVTSSGRNQQFIQITRQKTTSTL